MIRPGKLQAPKIRNLTLATRDVAAKAADLLEEGESWTQGVEALDRKGEACSPEHRHAMAWSATGAIKREAHEAWDDLAGGKALELANKLAGGLEDFNDSSGRTREEVVGLLRQVDFTLRE